MSLKDFFNKSSRGGTGGSYGQSGPNGTGGQGQNQGKANITGGLTAALVAVVVIFALFNIVTGSVYTLSETESAVVTTLGQATVNNNKGLQFKIPFIQDVTKINTTVRSFEVGYREENDGYRNVESESTMITSDMNFVDIDFYVTYQVTDPLPYLYATEEPELIL